MKIRERLRHWMRRGAITLAASPAVACAMQTGAPANPAPRTAARAAATPEVLRATIDSIVTHPRHRTASWGLLVVDPERGDTLYSRNAEKLLVPASNQKLITAAVALAALGPEFRFATRVAMSGVVRDTVLYGDLVVFGSGDPSFSDRIRGNAMLPLAEMADSLRARGITRVDGRLRRGTPVFTDAPLGFGWAWDDLASAYAAAVGDLMFNDTFAPVRVNVDGIVDSANGPRPRYRHFLDAFNAALGDRGVFVRLSYDWATPAPDSGLTTLFTYRSPPLREILPHFNKPSQNQIGEVLLKTLGLVRAGSGRADAGARVIGEQLIAWGADSGGFVVRDGSGLSRHDFLSAETLVRVLAAARRDTAFADFYASLPVAGVDGTLERRLRGTPAEGNARAKTGSMDRVRTLSGYVTTRDGRTLVFALMANAWTVPGAEVEAVLDLIVARLAALQLGG